MADGAGHLAWRTARPARARLAANLLQATGDPPGGARLRQAFRAYARYYLAFMRLAHQPPERAVGPMRWVDDAALAASVGRGRGTLVLTAHLGNWDLVGVGLAERFGSISVFAERLEPAPVFEFYSRVRRRHGMRVLVAGVPSRAPRAAFAGNGIVALVADRPFGRRVHPVPLGSGTLEVPAGGIELALRAGAAIHVVFAVRDGRGFVLRCGPDLAAPVTTAAGTHVPSARDVCTAFATALAAAVRRHPDQWCQLHALVA
jgi:KDO2-lipid IV(A) lauroyltransferase